MIQIKNLTKKYGDTIILNKSNYNFPNHGLVCLLGPSGCGKSTLLNLIAGFDSQYVGEIIVGNKSIHQLKADELCSYRRDCIGFIFQEYHLLSGYKVKENIMLSAPLRKADTKIDLNDANRLLEKVGLLDKQDQKIENLSGGQKQRVAIVRALIGNPEIILADEPTGALDRTNSTEIMNILKDIAKEKLVIVITHDKKICDFADEIILIKDGQIVSVANTQNLSESKTIVLKPKEKVLARKNSIKNFKVHLKRYLAVSLAISIGVFCFVMSLSFRNIMKQSIDDFKDKNTAFNNGYVKVKEDNEEKVFNLLNEDERIENVYKQYKLKDITLSLNGKSESIAEKFPSAKAMENMAYGVMPKIGQNQIAMSPSLAKKFNNNINELIGKEIELTFNSQKYKLIVSGIYGAEYDNFYISSDLERTFMQQVQETCYSISYDVKEFEEIVAVNQTLEKNGVESKTAVKEVAAFQETFQTISQLFLIVSVMIFAIGLFISIVLLIKLQNSRYREVGLLSALGFNKGTINKMIIGENILLSLMAGGLNALWISIAVLVSKAFQLPFTISINQTLLSIISTFVIIVGIGMLTSYRLIHTEPAIALRK